MHHGQDLRATGQAEEGGGGVHGIVWPLDGPLPVMMRSPKEDQERSASQKLTATMGTVHTTRGASHQI